MFSTAKTIKTGTKKKVEKSTIAIDGLETLASIDAVIKSLTALKATVESNVKSQMAVHFVTEGCKLQKRPANFKGEEGDATASCELRSRSSASGLSESEIELLVEHGIETQVVESVAETYVINPAYKDDTKLLSAIEKKLKSIKDIPEDLFLKQEGVSKTIIGETAMDDVFRLKPEATKELLSIVGVLAVKPKLDSDDLSDAFDLVKELVVEDEE